MNTQTAIVYIAQTLLRLRDEWQGNATSHGHIEDMVNKAGDLVDATDGERQAAYYEIISRTGYGA